MNHPTIEQLRALHMFQDKYGQRWRSILATKWAGGTDADEPGGCYLRQLRNDFGPDWLAAYRKGHAMVGWLQPTPWAGGEHASPGVTWDIVLKDGEVLYTALDTKTEARRTAEQRRLTLIEQVSV